jgi:hypothetical protein
VKPAQALKLANACETAVKTQLNLTARELFEELVKDEALVREVPVTLPSVSRALRTLVKSKRVRLVRKDNVAHYCKDKFVPRELPKVNEVPAPTPTKPAGPGILKGISIVPQPKPEQTNVPDA